MNSTDFIILIFGIIFLLYFYYNKETFELTNSLGLQTSILPIDINYGMNLAPVSNDQLVNKMKNVLEQEKIVRQHGIRDFHKESLKSANIVNYYDTPINIPYDLKRHDYKFEKNPYDVIKEMETNSDGQKQPLEMRKVFNNIIKNYSNINKEIITPSNTKEEPNKLISVDQNNFSYLDETKIPKLDDIQPLDSIQSTFSKC
ncbi:hypothetical protein crov466 [Cafeteria roenbergensis virus]|uniref:Uncharacterized protein n=1 Tax=Cafeteria roenbergensis virus (strain BV-PW1) TaxID=693272 RepID=E3T5N7_CROVB|nr:hypothetical protein crov466 [Cafeteria roenbergensis virus BV-PW1]ADO67500.1 hypothetical protein crov466 [Cafeteria roenbergensis virus BV-PW1]